MSLTTDFIATRGERLALCRTRYSGRDKRPDAFHIDTLHIVETDADERFAALVTFEVDDIDAAFEELDARFLAGEAAAHSQTWSVLAGAFAALNRREIPATTPDYVIVDHQRHAQNDASGLAENLRAAWDLVPDLRMYIEAVHRLSDLGVVVTLVLHGTSQEGLDAEWRVIELLTIEGDLGNRGEIFDEADLDAAVARFDQLSRPAQRLENAASQAAERFQTCLAACDWTAMAEILADDTSLDDRRRVVGAGVRHGRDVLIADMRTTADHVVTNVTSSVIAIRGERLVLRRIRYFGRDQRPEAFHTEILSIVEIDADERTTARVLFDLDDIDAAFEELDARYLAGEAAAHAHTWSVIARARAALVRRELPPTTPDWVNLDHRRGVAFAPGDMTAYFRAFWDVEQDFSTYVEAVHRLNGVGTVFTQVARGTSHEGFDAEWRIVEFMTVEGDLISRAEFFDETDIDTAIARFDELTRPAPRLENAASHMDERFTACFAARDWDAMAEILADDFSIDDRRRVVNIGIRNGPDVEIANMRAAAEIGAKAMTFVVIATRGKRLALSRIRAWGPDQRPEAFHTDALGIVEINADNRIVARVAFDPDDIDAAFEELDARYLAGEAAAHARTWSVMAQAFAASNRREMPEFMPDFVNIDHRRARGFAPGDLTAYMRATWDPAPDVIAYAEALHQLSNLGAVFTQAVSGTSQDGFEAEWREIVLATVDGNLINRIELFEEADIDAALTRFEQLSRPTRRLDNAASRMVERYLAHFAGRDWDVMSGMLVDDFWADDRRRVVNSGVRTGRYAEIANMQAIAELGCANITSTPIATRGARLVLARVRFSTSATSRSGT